MSAASRLDQLREQARGCRACPLSRAPRRPAPASIVEDLGVAAGLAADPGASAARS